MRLSEIATPALILDRRRLERNCARMRERAAALQVTLRPHLKTAKSSEVARIAIGDGPRAVTVSTLAEADYFARTGFSDITYAVGFDHRKLAQVARMQEEHQAKVSLLVDNLGSVSLLAREAAELGGHYSVLIEVDCGGGRGGFSADDPTLVSAARSITEARELTLEGVLTHAGHSYGAKSKEEIVRIAEDERYAATSAASALRKIGLDIGTVSVGSTPTALCAEALEGVTEIRPGVYTFFDLDQVARGLGTTDDIALSVLASVIGVNPRSERVLIDAGALALSKDLSADKGSGGVGYGLVCPIDGSEPILGARVSEVHQEHGLIALDGEAGAKLTPGARVRILPNHACMTAAPHDRYYVVEGQGEEIVDVWGKCSGWTISDQIAAE
jgi:D-serine deaminase-like pyridoxal phosphate-dependent protein